MLNIISPINQLGYGITGLNIVKYLSKITDVALFPIGQPQVTTGEDADIINKCITNSRLPDFNAPCIRIWHQHDMSQFVGNGTKIGFPIFELDKFSDVEKHHLSHLDKIFVCSTWAKNIILQNITIKEENVIVIPLGVDSSIFNKSPQSTSSSTIFFNCGKWEVRKGHDVLVKIFNDTFNKEDDVQLWLMCENPFLSEEEAKKWNNAYYQSKLGTKIRIIPRLSTQKEVYSIMSKIDCGIFPSRAEGWNLELLELMSCGKHVIATNYSAHTEFCNNKNALLVDISETEPAYDGKWFFKQGNWAKLSDNELSKFSEYMKQIHNQKQYQSLDININGLETANLFSWENSVNKILQNV